MLVLITAFANVLIYALLGWGGAHLLGKRGHARTAALCLALGYAMGNFGGHAASEPEQELLLRGAGSVLGIAVLSALLLYRRKARPIG